jgi:hypothetical protein
MKQPLNQAAAAIGDYLQLGAVRYALRASVLSTVLSTEALKAESAARRTDTLNRFEAWRWETLR